MEKMEREGGACENAKRRARNGLYAPNVKSTKSEVRRAELHFSSVSQERRRNVKRNGLSQRELVCAR